MKSPIKLSALSFGVVLLMMLWAPSASAFGGFDDGGGAGLPACAGCHADLANNGPDHGTHATLSNNDCGSCHDGGSGFDDPPLDNCVRCHGRDADAGGDNISAGLARGLRLHHQSDGTACGNCHSDATGPVGVGEDVLPSFYPQALGGAGLDSCDGTEEQFDSQSVSLDNDGDGLTDAADPDCAPANTVPVADAGLDQTVNVGDTVTLDGSGSTDADSDPLTYSWALSVPGGSSATLSDTTAVGPTFVPDVAGDYTATLIVNDGTDDSAPNDAVITAQAVNIPPVADAGLDQTVNTGDTVTLDGSGSSDADSDPLTYSWSLSVPGGSGATLSDITAVGPTFVPDVAGAYTATLIVNDGTDDSAPNDAVITAQAVVVNIPPVADAGLDQTVNTGDTVTLDGSGSSDADSDPLTYSWALSVPGGSGATLSDTTVVSPTFIPDVDGTYTATLIVNDGTDDSAPNDAVITAQAVVVNIPPVADAGLDQNVSVGDTVTLDGSGSSDADSDPLTYSWSLSAPGGSGATLSSTTAANPTYVADVAGDYVAQLIVNDGTEDSAADTSMVTASAVPVNNAPVADAGIDQNVSVGDTVTLDGSGSTDADADPLTYSWSLSVPGGSAATLSDPTAVGPTFVADVAGDYVAQLIVNDGTEDSAADTSTVTANAVPANNPPVADAGLDQSILTGDTVTLDASGSSDADGDPLTFSWSLSVPPGSGATLSDPGAVNPMFTADIPGDYVAQLIVNDGMDDSSPDSVVIAAAALPGANLPPVANAGNDRVVIVGATVALNGSDSSDPEDDLLTYSWSVTSAPGASGSTISDATAADTSIVADVAGDYVLQLIVNDGEFDSAPDTVMITALETAPMVVVHKVGGGAISLTFLWLLVFAVFLTRRRSIAHN